MNSHSGDLYPTLLIQVFASVQYHPDHLLGHFYWGYSFSVLPSYFSWVLHSVHRLFSILLKYRPSSSHLQPSHSPLTALSQPSHGPLRAQPRWLAHHPCTVLLHPLSGFSSFTSPRISHSSGALWSVLYSTMHGGQLATLLLEEYLSIPSEELGYHQPNPDHLCH